jgi:hypothetical protein
MVTSNTKARLSRCPQVSREGSAGCSSSGRLPGFEAAETGLDLLNILIQRLKLSTPL